MEPLSLSSRQRQIAFGFMLFTIPSYIVDAILLAVYFQPLMPAPGNGIWLSSCIAVSLAWLGIGGFLARPEARGPLVLGTVIESILALALGSLFSLYLYPIFPQADWIGQVAIGSMLASLVCLGTITLAPQPSVAIAWALGLYSGMTLTLMTNVSWHRPLLWILYVALGVVLVFVVIAFRQMFLARIRAEVQASNQSQLVGLLLHDFEEGSQDWIWEADEHGRLQRVSPRVATNFGRMAEELEGRRLVDLVVIDRTGLPFDDEEDLVRLETAMTAGKPFRDLEVPVYAAGAWRRWKLTAKPMISFDGTWTGWRGVCADVSEVQRLNTVNARLAVLDGLTGLANRHRMMTVLHDHLSPRDTRQSCVLVLADLKGFRMVNEGLGHDVGDQLLKETALRFRSRVPHSMLLSRLSGDEFAIVCPEMTPEGRDSLISALRAATDEPYLVEGHRIEATLQIGSATYPQDAEDAFELLKCAELALHDSKSAPEPYVIAYSPTLSERARKKIQLQGELRLARIRDEFELHYQAQIDSRTGALAGAEALIRWRHPARGLVSPMEFIPVLEETGDIVTVGVWILEAACREALNWEPGLTVSVNVSAQQFASRTFLDAVKGVLDATHFPPERLELEITESVMAQDPKQVVQTLQELRSHGISIALDDFGTGYSSLSYLRTLPLDKLKVDQSFVRGMDKDPSAAAIVRAVLDLSRILGLKTIAEGVETQEHRKTLESLGVDQFQGYLFSKPLSVSDWKSFREGWRQATRS